MATWTGYVVVTGLNLQAARRAFITSLIEARCRPASERGSPLPCSWQRLTAPPLLKRRPPSRGLCPSPHRCGASSSLRSSSSASSCATLSGATTRRTSGSTATTATGQPSDGECTSPSAGLSPRRWNSSQRLLRERRGNPLPAPASTLAARGAQCALGPGRSGCGPGQCLCCVPVHLLLRRESHVADHQCQQRDCPSCAGVQSRDEHQKLRISTVLRLRSESH